jgi:hypothetical protein
MKTRLNLWQGVVSIAVSILIIAWGVLLREGSIISDTAVFNLFADTLKLPLCGFDPIIIGATATVTMMAVAVLLSLTNRTAKLPTEQR